MDEKASITWRVRLRSEPADVYRVLATAEGRERFWAAAAPEKDGTIRFRFPDGTRLDAAVVETVPPERFVVRYFDDSRVAFTIAKEGWGGGAVVTLEEFDLTPTGQTQNAPGWVSVLLNLKAVVDFGIDLRNHTDGCTWEAGYVDT